MIAECIGQNEAGTVVSFSVENGDKYQCGRMYRLVLIPKRNETFEKARAMFNALAREWCLHTEKDYGQSQNVEAVKLFWKYLAGFTTIENINGISMMVATKSFADDGDATAEDIGRCIDAAYAYIEGIDVDFWAWSKKKHEEKRR